MIQIRLIWINLSFTKMYELFWEFGFLEYLVIAPRVMTD